MSEAEWSNLSNRAKEIFISDCRRLFFDTAEEDYIAARLLWQHGLTNNFCWAASQAIEKYVKFSLLVKNKSAKFGHNFSGAIEDLSDAYPGKLPSKITLPDSLLDRCKTYLKHPYNDIADEPFLTAVKRFQENGNTSQRYNETGYRIRAFDLHILDFICSTLRQLPLDLGVITELCFGDHQIEARPFTTPSLLGFGSEFSLTREEAFYNQNYSFDDDPVNYGNTIGVRSRTGAMLPFADKVDAGAARSYLSKMAKVKIT